MPVTSPQGTLDFKKVDKITFVGASSNTVIDTTTGSVGIGVVGDALSSNLHVVGDTHMEGNINMLHTSNTASIKLNSNVVTEFPRSKKLMKFPRVALTQNAETNGYAASASTEKDGTSTGQAYRVFDGVFMERGYHSDNSAYSSGTYSLSNSITDTNNKIHSGEWIKLQMPTTEKIQLRGFTFHPRNDSGSSGYAPYRIPLEGVFLGSTDGNNWYPIYYFYNFGVTNGGLVSSTKYFEPTNHAYYNHIAVVAYKLQNHSNGSVFNFAELELFGTPEYDPDAHGTGVVVKSVPNVPNTDWLEVYYDAKGLENGSTTVNDLKPVGTANNGIVGGNTSVTDEAFTFDGTGDYITSTVTTGTGNQSFSVACWFKFTTLGGLLWGFTGTTNGTSGPNPTDSSTPHAYFNTTGSINFDFWANATVTAEKLIEANRWYAGVWTYNGTMRKIYINGLEVFTSGSPSSVKLNIIDNTSRLSIGIYPTNLSGGPMTGSVANFRLFNRALTSDEAWQLYAYQKEYFGHGDLSMTLKAGRLGIGTSEPRAMLDVRGFIKNESAWFYAYDGDAMGGTENNNAGTFNNYTGFVPFNKLKPGSKYFTTSNTTSGGYFTAPCDGIYHFDTSVLNYPDARSGITEIFFSVNDDTNVTNSYGYIRKTNMPSQHCIMTGSTFRLSEGDSVKVYVINIDLYTDSYIGIFSGYLVTML